MVENDKQKSLGHFYRTKKNSKSLNLSVHGMAQFQAIFQHDMD